MYELRLVRERRQSYGPAPVVGSSAEVYKAFQQHFEKLPREEFIVLPLDAKHRVIGFHIVSVGSLTASIVDPRAVFALLLRAVAAAFICCHNHPSGDPTPSPEDLTITRRLREVGELHGIRLLDHIIFGEERYFSFTDSGSF